MPGRNGRNRGKHLNMTALRRRGWTEEMARALLPRPVYFRIDGHSVRF